MATTDKKRQEYIDSLYSKKEQKQIKESIKRIRNEAELHIQDYLLLDEEMRIIKKHFKLTPKKFAEIIDKVIIPFMVDSKKNIPLSKNKRYEKAHKQCY